jgi:hypothetical protein
MFPIINKADVLAFALAWYAFCIYPNRIIVRQMDDNFIKKEYLSGGSYEIHHTRREGTVLFYFPSFIVPRFFC